ncbi:pyrimidine-nucleoside phosphorylase [Clostridium sp. DL1XJH146]
MRMYDLILKKRNGEELSTEEITFFIKGYTNEEIPDYQVSALLMAIFFKKMTRRETVDLTLAMANSGDILDLSSIEGIKVDKHSTGGVGDKTSLVLAPLVASLGVPVAKMSGRGLGHTGGTIDKLESFPGFKVEISEEEFSDNVNTIKIAIAGQTANLAPADKKLYALRDVTATVDNISLIASSIMSKKIASGANCIVLDVKFGDGAFMKTKADAEKLAEEMVYIGKALGRKTVAILSDMDQPLGYAVGNILEVKEAIDTLSGNGPEDLKELCLGLGSQMLILANKAKSEEEARVELLEVIKNGRAKAKFKEFIKAQYGDDSFVDDLNLFTETKYVIPVVSSKDGYINKIKTEKIGIIAMELGAGRLKKGDTIDLTVGIKLVKKCGDFIKELDDIAYIYSNDMEKAEIARKELFDCFELSDKKIEKQPIIYKIIK